MTLAKATSIRVIITKRYVFVPTSFNFVLTIAIVFIIGVSNLTASLKLQKNVHQSNHSPQASSMDLANLANLASAGQTMPISLLASNAARISPIIGSQLHTMTANRNSYFPSLAASTDHARDKLHHLSYLSGNSIRRADSSPHGQQQYVRNSHTMPTTDLLIDDMLTSLSSDEIASRYDYESSEPSKNGRVYGSSPYVETLMTGSGHSEEGSNSLLDYFRAGESKHYSFEKSHDEGHHEVKEVSFVYPLLVALVILGALFIPFVSLFFFLAVSAFNCGNAGAIGGLNTGPIQTLIGRRRKRSALAQSQLSVEHPMLEFLSLSSFSDSAKSTNSNQLANNSRNTNSLDFLNAFEFGSFIGEEDSFVAEGARVLRALANFGAWLNSTAKATASAKAPF